jgi:transcriptional regulator of arginine metabolism
MVAGGHVSDRSGRARRRAAIRELVRTRTISTQDELLDVLAERGFSATQATLSRDLRDLHIGRVPSDDGYRYVNADESDGETAPDTRQLLQSIAPIEVVGVDANELLVVVRTLPGRAQGVAALLDRLALDEVLATIAGDDTVLVVPASADRTDEVRSRLGEMLGTTG